MEDYRAAAGASGSRPHVGAVGRDACEEEDHAVCADVNVGVSFTHGEGVGRFREEFVGHLVVA